MLITNTLPIIGHIFSFVVIIAAVASIYGLVFRKAAWFWSGLALMIVSLPLSGSATFTTTPVSNIINTNSFWIKLSELDSAAFFLFFPFLLIVAGIVGICRRKQLAWRNTAIASFALLIISFGWFGLALSNM